MPRSLPLFTVIAIAAAVALGALLLTERATITQPNGQQLTVAATIHPLYALASEVAGEDARVMRIAPPGSSPHTFEVSPSTLRQLQDVDVIFAIGHGLDSWVVELADSIEGATVVTVDRGIELRTTSTGTDTHTHGGEAAVEHTSSANGHRGHDSMPNEKHNDTVDPHYWLHFGHAQAITQTIAEELAARDSAHAAAYRERAQRYRQELASVEQELQTQLDALPAREILTLHGAWHYFAEHFDLSLVGSYQPVPAKQPSPQYLAALHKRVQKHDVDVIFTEPQLGTAALDTFAREHNLSIAPLDPIGGVSGRETYIELMRYNVGAVIDALER